MFKLVKQSFVSLTLGVLVVVVFLSTAIATTFNLQVDLIVKGGTFVTMDAEMRVIENGALAVKDGKIVEVGPSTEVINKYAARQTMDGRGRIIIPGLINGHTHIP